MTLRCVVLDIDDTLYLERDYARSGFRAVGEFVARELGADGFFEAAWAAFERGVRGTIFNVALEALDLPVERELIGRLVRVYRDHEPSIELSPDARAFIERVDRFDTVAMAGVTDGPLASQRAKASSLGLHQWLDPLVFTGELGEGFGKPHPRAFELIERAHHADGDELVYIADNPAKDFIAPRRLGWRTVRMRRPGSLHEATDSGDDVQIEVQSFEGLVESLGLDTYVEALEMTLSEWTSESDDEAYAELADEDS